MANKGSFTKENAREIGAKGSMGPKGDTAKMSEGGKNAAKNRRIRRTFNETLKIVLSMPLSSADCDNIDDFASLADLKHKNLTVMDILVLAQIKKAQNGDTTAFKAIRDTIGEIPVVKQDLTMSLPTFVNDVPVPTTFRYTPEGEPIYDDEEENSKE